MYVRQLYYSKIFGLLAPEDGTDRLSRNVSKKFSPLAASQPRRAQFPSTSRRKPEITR